MRCWPLLALALVATPAHALGLAVPRAALCGMADLVVVGEVTSTEVQWRSGDHGGLETHVDVAVATTAHGRPVDHVENVAPGGRKDGVWQWVEDVPNLEVDHRYLFFLRAQSDGTYALIGADDSAVPLRFGTDDESAAVASLGGCHVDR